MEELDKLIADYKGLTYNVLSADDHEFYVHRKKALDNIKGEICKTFVTTDLDPCYSPSADITFVLERTYVGSDCIEAKVVGLYHGEPDEESTKHFANGELDIRYDF